MGVLDGIRVLDLSVHFAGPYSTVVLSDVGAEVIRIERPGGDDDRRLGFMMLNGDVFIFVFQA